MVVSMIVGVVVGAIVGVSLGLVLWAMCIAASKRDDWKEDD